MTPTERMFESAFDLAVRRGLIKATYLTVDEDFRQFNKRLEMATYLRQFGEWLNAQGINLDDSTCKKYCRINYLSDHLFEAEAKLFPREKSDPLVSYFHSIKIDGRADLLLWYYSSETKNTNSIQFDALSFVVSTNYPRITDNKITREEDLVKQTRDILLEEGILHIDRETNKYSPTAKGYRIIERGGYAKHIKREKKIRRREKRDRKISRQTNISSQRTNTIQWIAASVTIIIIGYNAFIDHRNLNTSEESLQLQRKGQTEQHIQRIKERERQSYQSTISNLVRQRDSLKSRLDAIDSLK